MVVASAVHEGEGEFQVGEVTGTRYRADELAEHLANVGFVVEMIEYETHSPMSIKAGASISSVAPPESMCT